MLDTRAIKDDFWDGERTVGLENRLFPAQVQLSLGVYYVLGIGKAAGTSVPCRNIPSSGPKFNWSLVSTLHFTLVW